MAAFPVETFAHDFGKQYCAVHRSEFPGTGRHQATGQSQGFLWEGLKLWKHFWDYPDMFLLCQCYEFPVGFHEGTDALAKFEERVKSVAPDF